MYSYADRLRAVELYIRLGKRLNATIRQLGYPTKNALRGWYREYVQHLDLRPQPVARAPKYSEAERQSGWVVQDGRTDDRPAKTTTLGDRLLPVLVGIDLAKEEREDQIVEQGNHRGLSCRRRRYR